MVPVSYNQYKDETEYSHHPLIRALKGPKNLFELANVWIIGELLLGSEVHKTKNFVRIRDCSNYQVFELTGVNCITK